ncbi:hypothetical protein QTP88_006236 [Uroleucon formosanum]
MYIPSKPTRYGIKIVMMCDNATKYVIDSIPYLGKGTVPNGQVAADFYVKNLVKSIKGSNCNLTMDNWFCNVPLIQSLLHDDKLTVIGTIKKNKRELPTQFTDIKFQNRTSDTSFFLFHEDFTVVSYKPNQSKLVTLISSAHYDSSIDPITKKPEIVLNYNATKGGVDSFDQMTNNMNCSRKTKRWPLCFFYNMMNIANVNAYVIYIHNFYNKNKNDEKPMSRLEFMLSLHKELTNEWQRHRLSFPKISRELRTNIQDVLEEKQVPINDKPQHGPRKVKELCKLVSKHDPDFEHSYLQKINLSSWKVQEELIKMCADQVKEIILNQIVNVGFFAIMCDEAREEQLLICVRYVVDLQVYERFIGFVNVSSGQDANNILTAITDFFKTQTIDISTLKIIAQSYDGASVMSGRLNGVQAKIKELYPSAIYTHCMAHRLNLVVVDMCKNIKSARNVFNILEAVFVHFSRPSNHLKLSEIQSKLGIKKGNILRICDTRWVCRYKNCEAMLNNYTAIVDFLNYEVEEQSDKDVVQAMGILSSIQKSEFIVVLTILKEVLSIINVLSNTLQNKCATLGMSKNVIISVITTFENLRSDDEFSNVWRKIMHTAEKIGICLQNPSKGSKRQRREPKTLHDYVLTTTTGAEEIEESTSVETFWKTTDLVIVDKFSKKDRRITLI